MTAQAKSASVGSGKAAQQTELPILHKKTNRNRTFAVQLQVVRDTAVKRTGIRRRNPYHTRHTYAYRLLAFGANPLLLANQMGHENTQSVYIYSTWINGMATGQICCMRD
ncbi:tyrosine-type recombinase/integrase [Erwinia sp. PK3-005]|uniref:Tyrosine-type recombinase/integrase n=1 Tax=Mixta hanseatica TaxID=2872648 RepID=A0ABY4R6B5_9GAMM|nr:tyrosine-type recombinase/integrase [Mixta hanseatica]UQY42472.1 tyrosine-type recombinase/integrase [Mixta hanseatica]